MTRDPSRVDAELVALVREKSRAADEAEVRAALAPLSPAEEKALRKALRNPPPRTSLGPFGWADVARGVPVEVARAREVGGYYALQAERDALAAMVRGRLEHVHEPGDQHESVPVQEHARVHVAEQVHVPEQVHVQEQEAEQTHEREPVQVRARGVKAAADQRAQDLLSLFAYHRDAPLVARALRVSLAELTEELDQLKIRRKAFRLTRGTDFDLPAAAPVASAHSGPPVRRRPKRGAPAEPEPQPPAATDKELQARELKALLAEVGPRRTVLAARLGASGEPLSEAALLARFRAAGLERELSLRERDLIRALWSKHRASEARVASELSTTPAELRRIVVDRGLAPELATLRDRLRRDERRKKWPEERIAQVLHRRDELRELGVLEELEAEVRARAGVIWKSLAGKPDATTLFAKKLRLTRDDAVLLRRMLDLR